MQNKRWNRIRVGIAAVITSVSFAGANTVSVECAKQITPETITEEPTTQDFMDLIEYTKDWQTAEEVTPESASTEELQSIEVTQKDPMTMVPIKGIHACYGTIVEIRDNYILVQGLEENAINDRGIDWYSKSDIAAISGYVDGHECTSVDDLKVGDFVCAIRFGYMHDTTTNDFDGIAKFIVISRDTNKNEKAADKDLTRAAVRYAQKIAAKAADSDYLDKMELSDDAMQDTTNQTAAWNYSQIIHSQMSAYSAREGWDRDVLLVYSFSDLTVLVTIEQGDNNFMKVTPLLVLTEKNNENLGSQDQMDSFIQSLLEQYKFEKFDIAN